MSGKPKYKVPTMQEIASKEWNGYKVVSTFSGSGGSCLGYRMAGYKVLYANEFVEEAQKTYKANHPNSYLDTRDIREVTPESILSIIRMKKGEIDIFDGSPPCCAFSTAGVREKGWGEQRDYSDGKQQRVDDLFYEYIRILNGLQPKVFIAENVKGLITGSAKGYFKIFIREMQNCGYEVKAALLNAAYLGVPQARERIIFCGVRKDLVEKYDVHPSFPAPFSYTYSLKEAFDGLVVDKEEAKQLEERTAGTKTGQLLKQIPQNPKKIIGLDEVSENGGYFSKRRESMCRPCSTITTVANLFHPLHDRPFTIGELKRLSSLPDDFITTGLFCKQQERIGRMVPPLMMKAVAEVVEHEILSKCK